MLTTVKKYGLLNNSNLVIRYIKISVTRSQEMFIKNGQKYERTIMKSRKWIEIYFSKEIRDKLILICLILM